MFLSFLFVSVGTDKDGSVDAAGSLLWCCVLFVLVSCVASHVERDNPCAILSGGSYGARHSALLLFLLQYSWWRTERIEEFIQESIGACKRGWSPASGDTLLQCPTFRLSSLDAHHISANNNKRKWWVEGKKPSLQTNLKVVLEAVAKKLNELRNRQITFLDKIIIDLI